MMNIEFSAEIWERIQAFFSAFFRQNGLGDCGDACNDGEISLFRVFFWSRAAFRLKEPVRYDEEAAYARVMKRIHGRMYGLRVWAFSTAAAVLVLVGVGLLRFMPSGDVPVVSLADTVPSPHTEGEGIRLDLASGDRLVLDRDLKEHTIGDLGVTLSNHVGSGSLSYTKTGGTGHLDTCLNRMYVPKGRTYTLILPDSTKVVLNSMSSLYFPVAFSGNVREVCLEGEAFFKVSKDADHPFIVRTGEKRVKVLGTAFDISAYQDDTYWYAVLVNGSVLVFDHADSVRLQPSERYQVENATGIGRVDLVNSDQYISWVEGRLCFEHVDLGNLVHKLERWSGYDVIVRNRALLKRRFTGVIYRNRPIDVTLSYLERTTDIRFSVSGNTITVD